MNSSKPKAGIDWRFALLWAVTTTVGIFLGGFLGLYAAFAVGGGMSQTSGHASSGGMEFIAVVGVGFAVAATVVGGIQQWLIYNSFAKDNPFAKTKWWMLFTLLGAALTAVAINVVALSSGFLSDLGGPNGGILIGSGIGFAQWFLLKQHFSRAMWWMPVNAIAGGISFAMLRGFAPLAPVAYAIITAGVIAWIMQKRVTPQ